VLTGERTAPEAAERTLLAWIRTGLALMGFGLVVAHFGLFLQQIQFPQHTLPAQFLPAVPLVRHRVNRPGRGRDPSLQPESSSTGLGVGSGRTPAFSSIDPSCGHRFAPGSSWARDGDLPGFRTRLHELAFRKQ
jgi:Domain of unknown function (DUF202)